MNSVIDFSLTQVVSFAMVAYSDIFSFEMYISGRSISKGIVREEVPGRLSVVFCFFLHFNFWRNNFIKSHASNIPVNFFSRLPGLSALY